MLCAVEQIRFAEEFNNTWSSSVMSINAGTLIFIVFRAQIKKSTLGVCLQRPEENPTVTLTGNRDALPGHRFKGTAFLTIISMRAYRSIKRCVCGQNNMFHDFFSLLNAQKYLLIFYYLFVDLLVDIKSLYCSVV